MSFPHLSRRQLMHILSVGAGGFAFGKSETHWGVSTADAATPKLARFVYFNVPHGVLDHQDFVLNGGTETNFQFGVMTKPLEKVKSDVVILNNIELVKNGGGDCTHNIGMCQILTGAKSPAGDINTDKISTGVSLDHHLRKEIGVKVTPGCPSLLLSALGISYSFDDSFKRVAPISDPMSVFNSYLLALTQGNASPAQLKRLKTRKMVLDAVAKDVQAFRKTIPTEAKMRADVQLDILQSLSARVDQATNDVVNSCKATKPPVFDANDSAQFPLTAQYQCDMMAAALACDVTRIGMMGFYGTPHAGPNLNFAPVNRPDIRAHTASHIDISNDGGLAFRTFKSFCFSKIADFAEKLKGIPEPLTGGTMLDNTIILVGTGIGAGHSQSGLQLCTIGGKNLGIRTGRLLSYGQLGAPTKGQRINRVLVAIKQAMGLPGDTFNSTSDQYDSAISAADFTGPIPGLLS